jgi:hypothetical protein
MNLRRLRDIDFIPPWRGVLARQVRIGRVKSTRKEGPVMTEAEWLDVARGTSRNQPGGPAALFFAPLMTNKRPAQRARISVCRLSPAYLLP